MTRQPPPLRFLAAVVGLWICARALVLAPHWWIDRGAAAPAPAAAGAEDSIPSPNASPPPVPAAAATIPPEPQQVALHGPLQPIEARQPMLHRGVAAPTAAPAVAQAPAESMPAAPAVVTPSPLPLPQEHAAAPGRLAGSAWLLLRGERSAALAPGGTLGGSQAGVRLLYRLNRDAARPLALSARLYSPATSRRAAEAAVGLDWRPLARLPLHLLAERRQALGRDGRSAFALAVHGGIAERPLALGFRLDAYGQAGVVGARSRDAFADGAARVTLPVAGLRLGGGAWGGAQPGAARLDAGPHASVALPLAGENVRLAAEWRLRVAGNARPGSGPVLTLGGDF